MMQALTKLTRHTGTLSQISKHFVAGEASQIVKTAFTKQPFFLNAHTAVRPFSTNVSKEVGASSKTAPFAKEFWAIGVLGVGAFIVMKNPVHLSNRVSHPHPHAAEIAKMKSFLSKAQNERKLDERIEFIDTIFKVGESEAAVLKDQDVVAIIGTTNSGKSTFMDYINGCTFIKVNGRVQVAPNSPKPEIAQIGRGMEPTTICPQAVQINNEHFCDLPGFEDPRGFEVNIGICYNIKKIFDSAKSVRTVFLMDYNSIRGDGGIHVPPKLKLLNEVFNHTLTAPTKKDDGFVIVITHAEDVDPAQAIADLQKAANGFPLPKVYVYDPMMNNIHGYNDHGNTGYSSREDLLGIFRGMTHQSKANIIQMKLSDTDEKALATLGKDVEKEMKADFKKGKDDDLRAINHKLGFYRGLRDRFDTDAVTNMQDSAQKVFNEYVENSYGKCFNTNHSINQKSKKFADYAGLKAIVPEGFYDDSDTKINQCRNNDANNAWFYEKHPNTTKGVSGGATTALGAVGVLAGGLGGVIVACICIPIGIGFMGYAGWKHYNPSEEDKHRNHYFKT